MTPTADGFDPSLDHVELPESNAIANRIVSIECTYPSQDIGCKLQDWFGQMATGVRLAVIRDRRCRADILHCY